MTKHLLKRRVFGLVAMSLLLSAVGCGSSVAPVDPDAALTTLTGALDAWKAGRTPSDLRQQVPETIVSDSFWDAGRKLASYKVEGTGTADERGNFRAPVTLTLKTAKDPEVVKATYIVTVKPKATVYREYQD